MTCWKVTFLQVTAQTVCVRAIGTQFARWFPGIRSGLFHAAGKNGIEKAGKWSVKICLVLFWSSESKDLIADQMSDLLLA